MPPDRVTGLDRRHRDELAVDERVPLGRDVKRLTRDGAGEEVLGDVGHERPQHYVGGGVFDEGENPKRALTRTWKLEGVNIPDWEHRQERYRLSPEAEVASQP